MGEYQVKKKNKYYLPHEIYMEVKWYLKIYENCRKSGIIFTNGEVDGIRKAIWSLKQKYHFQDSNDVLRAYFSYPFYSCYFNQDSEREIHRSRWQRYKSEFAWNVAKNRGWIQK